MTNISGNGIISMTRGDTFSYPLFINAGSDLAPVRHIVSNTETVTLGITEANELFEDAILVKEFTNQDLNEYQDIVVSLEPEETKNLLEGTYYYEIKLYSESIDKEGNNCTIVDTVVPKTKFILVN